MYRFKSFAKINSYLNVISKLESGYHSLNTHFQIIDLHDKISFKTSSKTVLTSNKNFDLKDNLILKAKNWFEKKFDLRNNFEIHLEKEIPIGAGLGGGSSNAATTLYFLCKFHNIDLKKLTRDQVCNELGADVFIFLTRQSAFAEGRGEIITEIHSFDSDYLLLSPDINISTKEMFESKFLEVSNKIDKTKNCFLDVLLKESLEFSNFYSELKKKLPINTFNKLKLSGTGSTLFIENPDENEKELIFELFGQNFRVFLAKGLEYYDFELNGV